MRRVGVRLGGLAGAAIAVLSAVGAHPAAPARIEAREARAVPPAAAPGTDATPPLDADVWVSLGWTRYRVGEFVAAEAAFREALRAEPRSEDAAVGLGYARLQRYGPESGARHFREVLSRRPDHDDALRGLVLAGRRSGARAFLRVEALAAARALAAAHPGDREIAADLVGLEAQAGGTGERRLRPPADPSAPLRVPVRAGTQYLEIRDEGAGFDERPAREQATQPARGSGAPARWRPLFVKGVNLGVALPGRFPTEFPTDAALYAAWLDAIADLGANVVRIYTLLPPAFYRALAERDADPARPKLWLVQGVWTELPPAHDFGRPEVIAAFEAEIARVIDAVHGNLALAPRPGHASGVYDADASRALLALVVGREWEPFAVKDYLALRPGTADWEGSWLRVLGGNAMERWVAARCDFAAGYEAAGYRTVHPVTFASWPTLDPLTHPTESDRAEEDAWRSRYGIPVHERLADTPWENDAVTVDAAKISATARMEAGFFASYHVYPNYPDFLNLEPGRYAGYLAALRAHHRGQAVLVAELGMSTSRGIAHVQPEGRHHGGHGEADAGRIEAELLRTVHQTGCAGGIVFSWLDEWFKGTWSVAPLEVPAERRRLWLDVESPEQSYGLLAARPASLSLRLDGSAGDWAALPGRDTAAPGSQPDGRERGGWARLRGIRAAADEAYVWVLLETGGAGEPPDWSRLHLRLAIDTYDRARGERRLPPPGAAEVPVGIEFLVDLGGPGASAVSVSAPYEPYARLDGGDLASPSVPSGRFVPLLFETNRERIGRDGTRYPAVVIDRGVLRYAGVDAGAEHDARADVAVGDGVIELRLPWTLLNVADPSSRRVLHQVGPRGDELGTTETTGFRLYAFSADPRRPGRAPLDRLGPVAFTWRGWEEPRYRLEPKAGVPFVREAMRALHDPSQGAP